MRLATATFTAALCVTAMATMTLGGSARAATKIEGEYQLMMDMRKSQRTFPWDWDSNNNDSWTGAQLRLFSQPRANVESFFRIEADWNQPDNNTERPLFQFREAHLRFRWDLGGRGFDSYLFSRQDRFWVDNYLIKVVESGDDFRAPLRNGRWGPNAQGIRLDTWGFWGLNTAFIASDFSDQYDPANNQGSVTKTDDAFVARVRREFFSDRRLRLGVTWNRKQENQINEPTQQSEVYAFDSNYRWRNVDFALEYAESRSPIQRSSVTLPDGLDRKTTFFRHALPLELGNSSVLVAEVRTITFGTPSLGYVNFWPTYWQRGPLWDNRAASDARDETGFRIHSWYLVPDRAITITSILTQWSKYAFERRDDREIYNEAYIEFVNGFTGKTYYKQTRTIRDLDGIKQPETHNDAFFELQVESRLAWLRVQSKLKDIGQSFAKQLYSVENRFNLSDRVTVYNRFVFGNDASILRKGIFSQIQYHPAGSRAWEIFVEYGPSWIGDDSTPVNDGDLEGGGDQTDIIKFILKGTF